MNTPKEPHQPLFEIPSEPRTRTSDVLLALAERSKESEITLRILSERFGDRTFGMLLVLFSIFNVIPFVSLFAGLFVVSLGLQMAAGMSRAWLPAAILDRRLPAERVRAALLAFEPKVRAIERYVRPRWRFSEAPIFDRINGLIIAFLGIIIMIPLPLTNLGPAFLVVFMGLGLLERDGLLQIIAACISLIMMTLITYLIFGLNA